jgi:hypothetical protein
MTMTFEAIINWYESAHKLSTEKLQELHLEGLQSFPSDHTVTRAYNFARDVKGANADKR